MLAIQKYFNGDLLSDQIVVINNAYENAHNPFGNEKTIQSGRVGVRERDIFLTKYNQLPNPTALIQLKKTGSEVRNKI